MSSRFAMLLAALLASACVDNDMPTTGVEETRLLVGCWQGFQGDEHVEYRFGSQDEVVERDLRRDKSYLGAYSLAGDQLTLDFGEEPPTLQIEVTATTLTFVDYPFVFDRVGCSEQ